MLRFMLKAGRSIFQFKILHRRGATPLTFRIGLPQNAALSRKIKTQN
jgi:hypothetical protein